MTTDAIDLMQAAALALCIASAFMVGAIHLSMDRATRRRLEAGLFLLAAALLLFALRLLGHFRPDLVAPDLQMMLGSMAAVVFLWGSYRLLWNRSVAEAP